VKQVIVFIVLLQPVPFNRREEGEGGWGGSTDVVECHARVGHKGGDGGGDQEAPAGLAEVLQRKYVGYTAPRSSRPEADPTKEGGRGVHGASRHGGK